MSPDRERLANVVRRRRLALGLSESAAARAAGVARNTWTGFERGSLRTSIHKYADFERALKWEAGSIDEILRGGEPVETEPPLLPTYPDEVEAEILRIESLPLPARTRMRLLSALIGLQAEAAEEDRTRDRRAV